MNEELEELQNRLVQMLVEFRQFTDKYELQFFLVGGSALGAHRHKGFIPWDDDVDIAMMRSDFEQMEERMEEHGNRLGDIAYSPSEKYIIPEAPLGHLYDMTHLQNGYRNTAKIDIHPIDGVPQSRFLRKIQHFFSVLYYFCQYRHPVKNKGKKVRTVSRIILKIVPDFVLDFLMRLSKRIITHWDNKNSRDICSLFGVAGYDREVMPRSYLMPLKTGEFHGENFLVPCETDLYLKRLYGDYMALPPEEMRKPGHTIHLSYQKVVGDK